MTYITNTRELPWCELRVYLVRDEAEARQLARNRKAYLFQQTEDALYLFVEKSDDAG